MPSHLFFRSAGLFVKTDFLDSRECADITAQMREAAPRKALIAKKDGEEDALDESWRKVLSVSVEKPLSNLVKTRILEVKPTLEEHFRVPLTGVPGSEFSKIRRKCFLQNPQGC